MAPSSVAFACSYPAFAGSCCRRIVVEGSPGIVAVPVASVALAASVEVVAAVGTVGRCFAVVVGPLAVACGVVVAYAMVRGRLVAGG